MNIFVLLPPPSTDWSLVSWPLFFCVQVEHFQEQIYSVSGSIRECSAPSCHVDVDVFIYLDHFHFIDGDGEAKLEM